MTISFSRQNVEHRICSLLESLLDGKSRGISSGSPAPSPQGPESLCARSKHHGSRQQYASVTTEGGAARRESVTILMK